MDNIFFHIDVNSAFLSWSALELLERGESVDLRTVPSVVGGDEASRHGVVLAKSTPAKKYGIVTGEPLVSARRKCPGLITVAPDHHKYHERSALFVDYLHSICGEVQQASIDECYISYNAIDPLVRLSDPLAMADEIRAHIRDTFGFTVNVGISDRKVLAKMASDFTKPDKTHTLWHREIEKKMWPLPVSELFMCGKSAVVTLRKLGILTIGDLARADLSVLNAHLKSHGKLLWEFANGIDDSGIETSEREVKGIGNSSTYSHDLTAKEEIEHELQHLCDRVTLRVRENHSLISNITVEIRYADFKNVSHQKNVTPPCASRAEIFPYVRDLFYEQWDGRPIRLLGVRAGKLVPEDEPLQLSIDDFLREDSKKAARKKNEQLDKAIDELNARFGAGAVVRGSDIMK